MAKQLDLYQINLTNEIESMKDDIDGGSIETKINLGQVETPCGKICQVHLLITSDEDDFFTED